MAELTSIDGFHDFESRERKKTKPKENDVLSSYDNEQDLPPLPTNLLDITPLAANPWDEVQPVRNNGSTSSEWIVEGEAWLREFVSEQFEDLAPAPISPSPSFKSPFHDDKDDIPALRVQSVIQSLAVDIPLDRPALDTRSFMHSVDKDITSIKNFLNAIEAEQAVQSKQNRKWPLVFLLAVLPLIYLAAVNSISVSASENQTAGFNSQPQIAPPTEVVEQPVSEQPVLEQLIPEQPVSDPPPVFQEILAPSPVSVASNSSVLTQTQIDDLYTASLTYSASTEKEAVQIANSIGYIRNNGHPSNMCGPLAIAILQDAGLIDPYVDISSFWLLNPRDKYTVTSILEKYFPRENYLWYQTNTSVRYFDFENFSLKTGDFLYLFAGPRDTFEHMLTVTRVDDQGRAYTVSAKQDEDGFTISELMLYDPNDPGVGYFYDLTDRSRSEYGNAGSAGFWLWRPLNPVLPPDPNQQNLAKALDQIFEETGGKWHVLVKEINGDTIYSRQITQTIHPASVIKVPLAIQFFEALDYEDQDELRRYLETNGVKGRTFMQLLRATLVKSEGHAADILLNWIVERQRTNDVFGEYGAINTQFEPRRTTVQDIGMLFEGLYLGEWLTLEERAIILEFMAEYTSNDDTRIGALQPVLPEGSQIYNKRGSETNWGIIVADVAIIEIREKTYLVAIFGYNNEGGSSTPTYKALESAIEQTAFIIWSYLGGVEALFSGYE